MRPLHHELALLEMRAEQLSIHLRLLPTWSREANKARCQLAALHLKRSIIEHFMRDTEIPERASIH
jgi:hypothetical protein